MFAEYYLNHSASKQIITFGIFNETLKHRHLLENFQRKVSICMLLTTKYQFASVYKILRNEYNLTCETLISNGTYSNQKVWTNIYLNCTKIIIQLAIFYNRNNLIWIGADETLKSNNNFLFGDFPRAVNQ